MDLVNRLLFLLDDQIASAEKGYFEYVERVMEESSVLANEVAQCAHGQPTVVAVIGAGDIHGLVEPLRGQLADCEMAGLLAQASELPCPASRHASWGQLTTLGIGSARPLLLEPRNEAELQAARAFAHARELPLTPLGRGSNLVGTDDVSPHLALRLAGDFARWEAIGDEARVGAGVPLGRLARELAADGRCPEALLALAWIPATMGGATRMNAGAEGTDMAALVARVRGIRLVDGHSVTRAATEIQWGYRETDLSDLLITGVWLDLPPVGDAPGQQERLAEFARRRDARQPRGRSAGCVFRNPPGDAAGRLLDSCGCKGMRVGGAEISQEHANIFTAAPGTREADFLELIRQARGCVRQQTGIRLVLEVRPLGPWSD